MESRAHAPALVVVVVVVAMKDADPLIQLRRSRSPRLSARVVIADERLPRGSLHSSSG